MQRTKPTTRSASRPRPRTRHRLTRGRLYDIVSAATRVGVGWVFAEYGLALRGREARVTERLADAGMPIATFVAPLVPVLLVALSIAFAVGLLTWLSGPLLALAAVVGTLAAGAGHLPPFGSWGATVLVATVCVLLSVGGGRWSWDYLVLAPRPPARRSARYRSPTTTGGKAPTISHRRPEHAPPLLYPVEQAALRRPYRL